MRTQFRYVGGFGDNTDYVEAVKDRIWLVLKDGTRKRAVGYTLAACRRFVDDGSWIAQRVPSLKKAGTR